MKMYMQREQDMVKESEGEEEIPEESESDEEVERKKIGDKLFEEEVDDPINLKEMAKDMDPELFRMVIEKESPELIAMLNELQDSMTEVKTRL
jgi:hypothetical protein